MTTTTARITIEAAENLAAVFAGQTVTFDQVMAQIEMVYAMAGKRMGIRSYFAIEDEMERRGVTCHYEYPNFRGTKFHTFPAA